jgi:26S proteasome non-ATPase regulatory subunit 10
MASELPTKRKPIHEAALEGDLATVRDYVEQDNNAIWRKDDDDRIPLHWAVSGKHEAIVKYLLDADQSEDKKTASAKDDSDWTPLIIAVNVGSDEVVDLLLKLGVDPNVANEAGVTALVGFLSFETVPLGVEPDSMINLSTTWHLRTG